MTMKLMHLTTYWNADDALTVITFLDELRDLLWATYGEHILQTLRPTETTTPPPDTQFNLTLEDDWIPF